MKKPLDHLISSDRMSEAGLVRSRTFGHITRRQFGLGAAGAAAALGALGPRGAQAATDIKYTGWQGYDEGLDVDGWFAKNGMNLQTTYITAGNEEIIAAIQAGGKGNMDFVSPAALYVPFYAHVGLLEPLDMGRLPNYANLFPEFQHMDTLEFGGAVYGVPFVWGSIPLMYNADVIKEPPTSWRDMMKPEYKGKVALVHDLIAIMIPFAMVAANTRTPWHITEDELDATIDLIIQIKKENALTVAPGYGELGTMFANGEIVMAPAWEPTSVWGGAETTNLKWTIPEEGTLVFVDNLSIVPEAPHMDLAYETLNHALSPEAQANTANLNSTGTTVQGAVPMLDESVRKMYPYDDIKGWFDAAGGITHLWPTEPMGDYVTFDQVTAAWEKFLAA
jgi:spermidine/putrescine transport system substrate-binding protein